MNLHEFNYDLSEVPHGHYVDVVMRDDLSIKAAFCDWHGGFHDVQSFSKLDLVDLMAWRPLAQKPKTRHEPAKIVPRRRGDGYSSWI